MFLKTMIGSFARRALDIAGTLLAAKFALTCADLPAHTECSDATVGQAIGGLLLIAASYIWSRVKDKLAKRKLDAATTLVVANTTMTPTEAKTAIEVAAKRHAPRGIR